MKLQPKKSTTVAHAHTHTKQLQAGASASLSIVLHSRLYLRRGFFFVFARHIVTAASLRLLLFADRPRQHSISLHRLNYLLHRHIGWLQSVIDFFAAHFPAASNQIGLTFCGRCREICNNFLLYAIHKHNYRKCSIIKLCMCIGQNGKRWTAGKCAANRHLRFALHKCTFASVWISIIGYKICTMAK